MLADLFEEFAFFGDDFFEGRFEVGFVGGGVGAEGAEGEGCAVREL